MVSSAEPEAKKRLVPRAAKEGWLCLFYHDPDEPVCRLVEGEKGFTPVAYDMGREEETSA